MGTRTRTKVAWITLQMRHLQRVKSSTKRQSFDNLLVSQGQIHSIRVPLNSLFPSLQAAAALHLQWILSTKCYDNLNVFFLQYSSLKRVQSVIKCATVEATQTGNHLYFHAQTERLGTTGRKEIESQESWTMFNLQAHGYSKVKWIDDNHSSLSHNFHNQFSHKNKYEREKMMIIIIAIIDDWFLWNIIK